MLPVEKIRRTRLVLRKGIKFLRSEIVCKPKKTKKNISVEDQIANLSIQEEDDEVSDLEEPEVIKMETKTNNKRTMDTQLQPAAPRQGGTRQGKFFLYFYIRLNIYCPTSNSLL
jgi:hypothetical protein